MHKSPHKTVAVVAVVVVVAVAAEIEQQYAQWLAVKAPASSSSNSGYQIIYRYAEEMSKQATC
jgi:hypothetical protein